MTVSAYDDAGTGPTSDNRIQQTEQAGQLVYSLLVHLSHDVFLEPGVVSNLISNGSDSDQIIITWNQPSNSNDIIIMYGIRYRKSDNSDLFVYANGITDTQYIISGITRFVKYIIGVRAYTIAGPGEWIVRSLKFVTRYIWPVYTELLLMCDYNTGIGELIVEVLNNIVAINWTLLNYTELTSYVLEYKQTNEQTFETILFPVSVLSTGSLKIQHGIEYVFQVYGVFMVNSVEYESEKSHPAIVMIAMDSSSTINSTTSLISSSNDSQTGSIDLVAGASVLSIIEYYCYYLLLLLL